MEMLSLAQYVWELLVFFRFKREICFAVMYVKQKNVYTIIKCFVCEWVKDNRK